MRLDEILWRFQTALETIAPMRGQLEDDISEETAHATGVVLGNLMAAIDLIKRDIESGQAELAKTQRRPD